jgi:hypothetical protein
MMRMLLFLSLVGAAIYGFLVITGDALSGGNSKDGAAIQTQPEPNHSADERLSSWGSYLPRRSPSQNPQLTTSQEPAALSYRESNEPSQNSGRDQIALSEHGVASSESDVPKPGSIDAQAPTPISAGSTNEAAKPAIRKSSKRGRPAKRGASVANTDPWNGQWARRVERRRGFGLFMFRPFPRFAAQGR